MVKVEQNQSLVELALGRLRDDIVFAVYKPEQKLNIESLKKRYEMGGTPIREALNRLVVVGLVEALPLKGFRVHSVALEEAEDLLMNRSWVESLMIEQSLLQADDMWESLCIAALHRLKRCTQHEDFGSAESLRKWVQLSNEFFAALYRLNGSLWLSKMYADLYLHSMRYEYQSLLDCEDIPAVVEAQYLSYSELLEHCLERELSKAQHSQAAYMTNLTTLISRSFQSEGAGLDTAE